MTRPRQKWLKTPTPAPKPAEPAELVALSKEVAADPKADALLRAKCQWEQMTRMAVLKEWGDPRNWADYNEEGKS